MGKEARNMVHFLMGLRQKFYRARQLDCWLGRKPRRNFLNAPHWPHGRHLQTVSESCSLEEAFIYQTEICVQRHHPVPQIPITCGNIFQREGNIFC